MVYNRVNIRLKTTFSNLKPHFFDFLNSSALYSSPGTGACVGLLACLAVPLLCKCFKFSKINFNFDYMSNLMNFFFNYSKLDSIYFNKALNDKFNNEIINIKIKLLLLDFKSNVEWLMFYINSKKDLIKPTLTIDFNLALDLLNLSLKYTKLHLRFFSY